MKKYIIGGLAVAGLVWYSWFGENRIEPVDLNPSYVVPTDYLLKSPEVVGKVEGLELILK